MDIDPDNESLFVIEDDDDDVLDSALWGDDEGEENEDGHAPPRRDGALPMIFHDIYGAQPLRPTSGSRFASNARPSSNARPTRRSQRSTQTQTENPIIDLTAEPDSPERRRPSLTIFDPYTAPPRNPRRTNSQRISPPRLARSDSTFFASTGGVIDLTADSPEETRPPQRPQDTLTADDLIELEFIGSAPRQGYPQIPNLIGLSRRFAGFIGTELLRFPAPQLDISRTAFNPGPPLQRPPMEPIPPARKGFTRNTCADPEKASENVVICPACEEELAYDPSGPASTTTSPTVGKKRKRAAGEHHFWAIKKCGHVYCADCFENRRPKKGSTETVGFRFPEGKPHSVTELRCAVDGCESKVANKGEWVGIFL